jgi:C4-dicarboxylate-specific signal transduction histidine kinase
MKIPLRKFVVIALGVLTVGVFAGRAQITNQLGFKMSQPFTVGNTTLAPGSYVVRPVQGTDQQVIEISGATGKPSVMVDVNAAPPDSSQTSSQLVFNKYKNVLALSAVFPGGGNQGYQLVQGHPEQLAAKTEKPTKQTVTATGK